MSNVLTAPYHPERAVQSFNDSMKFPKSESLEKSLGHGFQEPCPLLGVLYHIVWSCQMGEYFVDMWITFEIALLRR